CTPRSINECYQFTHILRNVLPLPQMYIQEKIPMDQKMALVNIFPKLGENATVIEIQVERENDRVCVPAKLIVVPAACSKLTADSKAKRYCYLRFVESYVTDLNLLIPLDSRDTVEDETHLLRKEASAFHRLWSTLVTFHELLSSLVDFYEKLSTLIFE
ncbi:uncharacterized protein LOC118761833, partial [Octopus sinensis]|uniref:Uncharacterized protein LOC118761833 n=1 Tax=Octopus sinensis TaxID=2607531 RepID=A0A7E6EM41_9MOLL